MQKYAGIPIREKYFKFETWSLLVILEKVEIAFKQTIFNHRAHLAEILFGSAKVFFKAGAWLWKFIHISHSMETCDLMFLGSWKLVQSLQVKEYPC